jgi:hypothetical protein
MNKFLITTALLLAFGAMPAKAVTATFCGPDSEGGTCEGASELKVFLNKGTDETAGTARVGSPTSTVILDISSDTGSLNQFIDEANGFATITPTPVNKGGGVDFNGITISIPHFTFTDIAFDVQLTPVSGQTTDSFTVSDFSGAHVLDAVGTEFDKADTDKQFSTTAVGGAFTSVDIHSLTGFDEIKHIEISGLAAVPEPSTWALMGLGFAALGLLGYRKTRSALA